MMWNGHCLKSWSSTQPTTAISVAEAEYYALVEGATRPIAMQSMLKEMGQVVNIEVQTDSSSAKSFASRKSLGKMRRIWGRIQAGHSGQKQIKAGHSGQGGGKDQDPEEIRKNRGQKKIVRGRHRVRKRGLFFALIWRRGR